MPTDDGLQLYDGQSIRPASGPHIGQLFSVTDLPSIGRTLVVSEKGLFDLSADGALIVLDVDFPTSGFPHPAFIDWSEADVALVTAGERLYALDADLNAVAVAGGKAITRLDLTTTVAATGDKLIPGKDRFYLAVDTQRAGREICKTAN